MLKAALLLLALGAALLALAPGAEAADATVDIVCAPGTGWAFSPTTVTINEGERVTWANPASTPQCTAAPHTATSQTGTPAFDTGNIAAGSSRSVVFTTPGTWTYRCSIHPTMPTATVVVQDVDPTVRFTKPTANQEVNGTVPVELASSADATEVSITVDNGAANAATRVGGTNTWIWSWDTTGLAAGDHTLRATTRDAGSRTGTATPVTVKVVPPNPAPVLSITGPAALATVTGTVSVTGTATDADGIAKVEVRIDSGAWATATGTTEWIWSWDTRTATNGEHDIHVRAEDTKGKNVTHTRRVTVANAAADATPPTVTLTSPANGSVLRGEVTLRGNATDDRGVTLVTWRVDAGTWRNATGTAPWTATLDTTTLANGWHNLTARAADASGKTNDSEPVTVRVDNPPPATDLTIQATNGTTVSGVVSLRGRAQGVLAVAVFVDNVSKVQIVPHDEEWTWAWDTRGEYADGVHAVEVRAAAGSRTLIAGPVYLRVANAHDDGDDHGHDDEEDEHAPRITNFEPADGVSISGAVRFRVVATHPDGEAVTIRLFVDGKALAERPAPLVYEWPAYEARLGTHAVRAEACDDKTCTERTWVFTVVEASIVPEDETDDTDDTTDDDGTVPGATQDDDVPLPILLAAGAAALAATLRRRR